MSFFGLFGPPNIEKLKAKQNINGLIKALGYQKDPSVRQKAAEALGEIGDASAVESLIEVLKQGDSHLRRLSILALGKIGDVQATESLLQILEKQGNDFQGEATIALQQIIKASNLGDEQKMRIDQRVIRIKVFELIGSLDHRWKDSRLSAAEQLITLYHSEKLDDETKNLILKEREVIIQAHTDLSLPRHIDNDTCFGHMDYEEGYTHNDTGIGLDFPL